MLPILRQHLDAIAPHCDPQTKMKLLRLCCCLFRDAHRSAYENIFIDTVAKLERFNAFAQSDKQCQSLLLVSERRSMTLLRSGCNHKG